MGLGGVLVKKVFNKNRASSIALQGNEKSHGDKCKWASVRIYLCGDEFESVVAENDDTASVRSTEATMVQPVTEPSRDEGCFTVNKEGTDQENVLEDDVSVSQNKLSKENAAIFIQSAFRGFLARRKYLETRKADNQTQQQQDIGESEAASTDVQIGGSVENMKIREESVNCRPKLLPKSRSQGYRLKEEWDDSTVSSNVLKLRIQNRLEAMTRRERALAYAFSQQLRTCSTKKRSPNSNMGWSWLERWMATRVSENYLAEDCLSNHLEPTGSQRRTIILKNKFDIAAQDKESCGSNDVSVNMDSSSTWPLYPPRDCCGPATKNRLTAERSVSRRKTAPDGPYVAQHGEVNNKKAPQKEIEREGAQTNSSKELRNYIRVYNQSPSAKY